MGSVQQPPLMNVMVVKRCRVVVMMKTTMTNKKVDSLEDESGTRHGRFTMWTSLVSQVR